MPKPKTIEINIPSPCSQNWDEMIPAGSGRFCNHCQKKVIDFTAYSDAALYTFFSKNTGHVCGRFLSTQVNRTIAIPYQPHSKLYRITVALGLTLIFTQTPDLLAQNKPPKITKTANIYTTAEKQDSTTTQITRVLNGQVLDNKKDPLINAPVMVYHGDILKSGAITDYDGNYIINPLDTGTYNIIVSYSGFDSISEKLVVLDCDRIIIRNFELKLINRVQRHIIRQGGARPLYRLDNSR